MEKIVYNVNIEIRLNQSKIEKFVIVRFFF